MNIDVIAHVESGLGRGGNLNATSTEVSEPNGSNKIRVKRVIDGPDATSEIYREECAPMVDLQVAGYNVSTILIGTAQSAHASLVQGGRENGIFHQYLASFFDKLDDERSIAREAPSSLGARKEVVITLTVLEVQGESAVDLVTSRTNLKIEENAENGDWFRSAAQRRIYSAAEASQLFTECWQRSAHSKSDRSGSDQAFYAHLDLTMHFEETSEPHKSRYSCVILPAVDGLAKSRGDIKSVSKLISELSHHQHPDRVIDHRETIVTKLLDNELGGNCTTKVLALFNKSAELPLQRELLTICKNAQKVNNFPIMNDAFVQKLITQYRAAIIHHRKQPVRVVTPAPLPKPPTPQAIPPPPQPQQQQVHYHDPAMEPPRYENQRLLDQVERLQMKIEQLNTKFSSLASAKAELSSQLVDTEEEKLRATKAYIDMQIQNNKLREEMESSKYELTNKILTLEHDYQLSEIERQKLSKESSNLRYQLKQLEADRKSLADEYISLKTSYMSLTDDVEREVAKNDELTMELLNLINARSVLAHQTESRKYEEEAAAMGREEDRIRSMLHRLSNTGNTMDQLRPVRRKTDIVEKELFGNQSRYQEQLEKVKNDYSDSNRQLQDKLATMEKELTAARSLARERQQKISFLNAKLITTSGENSELKTVNNRLQHKIKDINAEYRLRLTKYVEDISSHIDSQGKEQAEESLAKYVNKMIKDVKLAHRNREDQLSQAAQSYKTRLEGTVKKHEELLCAYRDLRSQVEMLGRDDLDLGPDEHELIMTEAELQSSQQREIVKLQSELHNIKINNKLVGDGLPRSGSKDAPTGILKNRPRGSHVDTTFSNLDSWTSVRKELRNFSEQSLRELEEERASLLSKNVILEEQLKESQDYIDKHLARYKEEINRLRQQLAYKNRS